MDLWPQIQAALENKIHSYGLQYDTIIMHEIRRNISNEVSQSVMENTVRYVLHDNTADFCSWIYAHLPPPCGANLTDYQVLAIERGHVGRRIIAVLDSPDSDTVPERMLDSGSEEIDPNALESSDDNVQANSPVPVPADANVNMVEAEAEEEVMGEAEAEEEVMGEAEAEEEAMGEAEAEEEAMGEAEDDSDYEMEEFEDTTGSDSGDDENGEEDDSDDPDAAHLPAIDASSTENTTAEPTASVAQPEQAEFALDAMARRSRSRSPLARSKTPKRSSQDDEDVKDTTVEAESPSKQIRKRHRDFDNGVLQVNTARSPRRVIPAEEELEETGFLVRVGDGPSRRFLTDDGPPGDENFAAIKRRRRLDNPGKLPLSLLTLPHKRNLQPMGRQDRDRRRRGRFSWC
uniref:C3H1-type domain-containing protein n=1 Tax=Panagrellus redivivus TaxID=6233 RepID=A0A7E4VCJ1_PANRE